jgi:NADH-quinone oxidoreductase subunit M
MFCPLPAREGFADVSLLEGSILAAILALVILIGIYPRWLLDLIGSASSAIIGS